MGYLLALPVIGIVLMCFIQDSKVAGRLNILLGGAELCAIFTLAFKIAREQNAFYFGEMIHLDSLNMLQLLIIGVITFAVAIYSLRYVSDGVEVGRFTLFQVKLYYVLFNCFVFSMILLAVLNNVGLMWIALEATTLSTAFFIGFTRRKESLEAAWKYLILCTLGIGLALLGITLFLYGAVHEEVEVDFALANWTALQENVVGMNPKLAAVAFAIILIGFGTKVGFAPMHAWLPDAYSESPSPISAMMSGILGSLTFYGITRFYILTAKVVDIELLRGLLITFGIASLVVAGASILRQKNYKRMLAFSSIENMGIIALGFGFGGIGVFFALFHTIMQALSKGLLFLVAGNITKVFKTNEMEKIRGMFSLMPLNAFFMIIGMLALIGMPPFASFVSEFGILKAGIESGHWFSVTVLAGVLLLVFAGFIVFFSRMLFYREETAGVPVDVLQKTAVDEKLASKAQLIVNEQLVVAEEKLDGEALLKRAIQAEVAVARVESMDRENLLAPALLTAVIIGVSLYIPEFLKVILTHAAEIIG